MAVRGGWAVLAVLVSACGFLGSTPPPQPPRQTSMGLAISSLELKNGLRVVLVRDERASEVQVTMRYRVGSKDDPAGQEGVAHLVEHLMFQQVLGGQSLFAKLQTFATFMNAFTSADATTYIERAKASHLEEMLSVEAVRVGFRCTSLTDATFVRERAVVLNEIAMRGAGRALYETIQDGFYPEGHPYRHRNAGTAASVGAITREQACAFADAHYAPENAVLVVSGNIAPKTLEEALGKFIARVARRDAVDPLPVPVSTMLGQAVEVKGAVDDELLVVAWPQPQDLAERAKVSAIVPLLVKAIDAEIEGKAYYLEFGDRAAPMFGVAIGLGDSETIEKATTGVKKAVAELPMVFRNLGKAEDLGEAAFDRLRQGAIYDSYAHLDDTVERDTDLASYMLAGLDPAQAVGQAFAGLRELGRNDAARVAEEVLRYDHAAVVIVKPQTEKKLGRKDAIAPDIHDIGQHRDPPDPAEAAKPAAGDPPANTVPGMTTRVLPNGLKVVLLPVTSVPTVDIRLVFGAGTADELPNKRGAAIVAGNALVWDARYVNDYLLFAAAGGSNTVSVEADTTTFIARGLDMHIDVLLAGLRRWVRDGRYPGGDGAVPSALRSSGAAQDLGPVTDAWRAALYGQQHPYTRGGLARHAAAGLVMSDAKEFRREHFTPDNATLVISGRFDGPLADRWVDFLFKDWKGHAAPRVTTPAASSAASLATDLDTVQIGMDVVIPARTGTRAQQLVAAQMLDEIAEDIRHQLGASYSLNAGLFESRLATSYLLGGTVESARAKEALELVRSRLDRFAKEPAAAASAFVAARTRVIAQLSASEGTAGQIASRVVTDAQFGRAPLSDLATAAEVHRLTISDMASTLADLDLSRAAIQLAGPAADVDAAFAALGRTAQHVSLSPAAKPAAKAEGSIEYQRVSLSDLASPLAGQPPSTRFRVTAVPFALATGKVLDHGVGGYGFAFGGELRLDHTTSVGILGSIGFLDGIYESDNILAQPVAISVVPLSVGASIGSAAYDRLWGRFSVSFHANLVEDGKEPSDWETGIGVGLQGGVDILKLGRHRAGLVAAFETDLFTATSTTMLSLGVAYRY